MRRWLRYLQAGAVWVVIGPIIVIGVSLVGVTVWAAAAWGEWWSERPHGEE